MKEETKVEQAALESFKKSYKVYKHGINQTDYILGFKAAAYLHRDKVGEEQLQEKLQAGISYKVEMINGEYLAQFTIGNQTFTLFGGDEISTEAAEWQIKQLKMAFSKLKQ